MLNNTWFLYYILKMTEEEKKKKEEERRSAELGNTKETLGVPTSLNNFPTTAVAPYWINQRLQSKTYHQTPSLHLNERLRCTSCAVFSKNSLEYEREDNPTLREKTISPLKHPLQEPTFNSRNKTNHPGKFMRNERCLAKASSPSGFVRMSACWSLDSVYWMLRTLRSTIITP